MNNKNNIKRAANFNSKEEIILISFVKKYKEIIECRKTDTVTNKQKTDTWEQITEEFNSSSGVVHRDSKILKNKYENIKKRTKKKSAEEKTSMFLTGGGPPKDVTFTPVEEEIKELLGVRIEGLASEYDDDAMLNDKENIQNEDSSNEVQSINTNDYQCFDSSADYEEYVVTESESQVTPDKGSQKGDWTKITPNLLKQPKSLALQTPTGSHSKKRQMSQRMEQWVASKTGFEETKKKCIIEESRMKIQLLQKEHEKKMEILELESRERQRRENEEHEIRMEILQGQKIK